MLSVCSSLHCHLQADTSEFGAVAELQFDDDAAAMSGHDAFAELVQMAVREDPSLASAASTSGLLQRFAFLVSIRDT